MEQTTYVQSVGIFVYQGMLIPFLIITPVIKIIDKTFFDIECIILN